MVALGEMYEEKRPNGSKTLYLVVGRGKSLMTDPTRVMWNIAILLNPPHGCKIGEVIRASEGWFSTSYAMKVT